MAGAGVDHVDVTVLVQGPRDALVHDPGPVVVPAPSLLTVLILRSEIALVPTPRNVLETRASLAVAVVQSPPNVRVPGLGPDLVLAVGHTRGRETIQTHTTSQRRMAPLITMKRGDPVQDLQALKRVPQLRMERCVPVVPPL